METTGSGTSCIRAWCLTLLQVSTLFSGSGVEHCPVSAGITCSSGGWQAAPGDTSWKWSQTSGSEKSALTCLECCNKGERSSNCRVDAWRPSAASEQGLGGFLSLRAPTTCGVDTPHVTGEGAEAQVTVVASATQLIGRGDAFCAGSRSLPPTS